MPESFEREAKEGYAGPVNSEGKAVYGHRNAEQVNLNISIEKPAD